MYLMYVDESGDCGLTGSPKRYFVLTGLIIHETAWQTSLDKLIGFRQRIRNDFGVKLREELHAYALISKPGQLARIAKHERLAIIRLFADELASINDLRLINVVIDKQGKPSDYDVFGKSWTILIQRFENTIRSNNFPNFAHENEYGMIFPDQTDNKKLTQLLRQMRRFNPIPNQNAFGQGYRNLMLSRVAEDPHFKDSMHSYFVQAVDMAAYLLNQSLEPCSYMRKKAGQNYFRRLSPIFCTVASMSDPDGIVRL